MRILISGYYGFGNVGDEAVLMAILAGFRQRDLEGEITVLSASPRLTAELNQVRSVHRYDWLRLLREMWRADILVSGGGTLFQDVTSTASFWYYIGIVLLGKLFRKKVVVFSQGFGPLRRKLNQAIARLVLNRVDLVTLRDSDSFEELSRLGIKNPRTFITGDPSAILDLAGTVEGHKILSLEGIPSGKPLLGVSIRKITRRPELEEKVFPLLARVLDHLVKDSGYQIVYLLFQCPEDMAEASKVISLMKQDSNIIFRICRPEEMLALISQFDLLIGMRLHSLIFAALHAVPMLGISYDPKVEAFMKMIGQPCLELDQVGSAEDIMGALQGIIANKEAIRRDLAVKRKDLYDKAMRNFELFSEKFSENK